MGFRKPRVLLIGETVNDSSYLAKHLEECGCECSFAKSCRESASLIRQREFDLVLSSARLRDGSRSTLIRQLSGSGTTLFYYHAVERGCWWLPALRRGQECFGSPALRSREFLTVLDEIIKEIRSEAPMAVECPPFSIPQWRGSVAALSDEDSGIFHSGLSVGTGPTGAQIAPEGYVLMLNDERKVSRTENELNSATGIWNGSFEATVPGEGEADDSRRPMR